MIDTGLGPRNGATIVKEAAAHLSDDGALIWLNGQLAVTDNMPEGAANSLTPASNTVGGADESAFFDHLVDTGLLRDGENTLAVEIHQSTGASSDLSFDFSLAGRAQAANRAPTASAGGDFIVTLPAMAVLKGAFTDDGIPSPPGVPAFAWTKVSGPGEVTFASPASPDSTAAFSATGNYVLRFTVNDGSLSATDAVAVAVVSVEGAPALSVVFTGTSPSLHFVAAAGASYSVQVRNELVTGRWTTVRQVAAGPTGQVVEVPLLGSEPQRYYRVVSPAVL